MSKAFVTNVGMRYPKTVVKDGVDSSSDRYVDAGTVVDDIPETSIPWLLDEGSITPKWAADLIKREIENLRGEFLREIARRFSDVAVPVGSATEADAPPPEPEKTICDSFYEAVEVWLQRRGVFDVLEVTGVDAKFNRGWGGSTYTAGEDDTEELAIHYTYKSGVEGVYHHECFLGDFITELTADEGGWEA